MMRMIVDGVEAVRRCQMDVSEARILCWRTMVNYMLLNVWFSGLDGLHVCSLLDLFLLVGHCCVGGKTHFNLPGCVVSHLVCWRF